MEEWIAQVVIVGENAPRKATEAEKHQNTKAAVITQEEMAEYLEHRYHITKQDNHQQTNNPYPLSIWEYQYPEGYVSPKFKTYDGRGNARKHICRFLSAMNDRISNEKLCLRLFPKSMAGTAFTWYDNLKEESTNSWPIMYSMFMGKFYSA